MSKQCLGPFAKFLERHGICTQYMMLGIPQQNGAVERHNRTLMKLVRSMMSYSSLPLALWMYTLKTSMYLLNRVPNKVVPKTPFEQWMERKPSLWHLHVWGCPAKVRIYNPHEKKFDLRTISGYFIGYAKKSKGYKFYCPNHSIRIVVFGNTATGAEWSSDWFIGWRRWRRIRRGTPIKTSGKSHLNWSKMSIHFMQGVFIVDSMKGIFVPHGMTVVQIRENHLRLIGVIQ